MNLQRQLTALQEQTRDLDLGDRARVCCRAAKQLEKAGEYDAACEALGEFWPQRNGPPKLAGLDEEVRAVVLLRVGALAGWLGSSESWSD